jgi:2,3-bisphosphoglycerate-independent phosphoglycerate mutase
VAIKTGEFAANPTLLAAIDFAKQNNKPLHLMGLVSDGGVHSHTSHLKALTSLCAEKGLQNVRVHAFTDGRDTDPKSGLGYLTDLKSHLDKTAGTIASITGRYFAMDRDKRWERVKLAYDALVNGIGEKTTDVLAAVKRSYEENVTDEFIKPIINSTVQHGTIQNGDVVICFNFRTDRCREITQVLTQTDFPDFGMKKLDLDYTTMTQYDHTYKYVHVVFENDDLKNTLGEILEQNNKTQIRIAETEKYPHVSFFFSGGREKEFVGERRLMVQSPKVATYDLQPEMSAYEVADVIVKEIENNPADFICLNFANADMVGHTGVWEAVIKAVETVDTCVEKVVTAALKQDYAIFILADHGNADYEINEDGSPNTAHTLNLVPFFIVDNEWKGIVKNGKLGDIAPTILTMMGLPLPKEMTGNILV